MKYKKNRNSTKDMELHILAKYSQVNLPIIRRQRNKMKNYIKVPLKDQGLDL